MDLYPDSFCCLSFSINSFLGSLISAFLAWRKEAIPWPKAFRERVTYAGRFLTWVLWPMALMALGIKYLFELNN